VFCASYFDACAERDPFPFLNKTFAIF